MSLDALAAGIVERLARAGAPTTAEVAAQLAAYVEVLARWNRTINLTAFDLSTPSAEAIDRLIVEPVLASRFVPRGATRVIDLGSGGGSPGLPLRIARPDVRLVLVESRARKCAFLREAVRAVGLEGVSVENGRIEDVAARWSGPGADVVTIRAVRADAGLWRDVRRLLGPDGKVLWFRTGAPEDTGWDRAGLAVERDERLLAGRDDERLVVLGLGSG